MNDETVLNELKRIAKENDGVLKPEEVIKEAEKKTSVLHDYFTWDDSTAAREYRLWEARQLIRVQVQYFGNEKKEYKVFVSLSTDQVQEGGGYRELISVMYNQTQKQCLLQDAIREMELFIEKYKSLEELDDILSSMSKFLSAKKKK